jgi:hypothetical protein
MVKSIVTTWVADVAVVMRHIDMDYDVIYRLAVMSNTVDELRRKVQGADSLWPGLAIKLAKILEPLEVDE